MDWPLFALILIIVFAVIILCYLNFDNFSYFMENYFIFLLLIVFIILLFVVDFNNQIQITTYVKVKNVFGTPLVYQTPYHSDTDITDTINVSFTGSCQAMGIDAQTQSVTNTQVNFDMNALAIGDTVSLYANNEITNPAKKLFDITKTATHTLSVINTSGSVDGGGQLLDGYLTLTLLCTGSQSIESSFKRLD